MGKKICGNTSCRPMNCVEANDRRSKQNRTIGDSVFEDKLEWQPVWRIVFTKQGAEDVKRLKSAGLKYEEAIKIIRMWTHYEGSQ